MKRRGGVARARGAEDPRYEVLTDRYNRFIAIKWISGRRRRVQLNYPGTPKRSLDTSAPEHIDRCASDRFRSHIVIVACTMCNWNCFDRSNLSPTLSLPPLSLFPPLPPPFPFSLWLQLRLRQNRLFPFS